MQPQSITSPEEWRPVIGYEGWYDVSSLGKVRRIMAGPGAKPGHILRPTPGTNGYSQVLLWRHGGRRTVGIHRLVAQAFLGLSPVGYQVNHKDGHKANNCASNLEWVTHSQNTRHAYELGRMPPMLGEGNGNAKLSEADVRAIRAARGEIVERELAATYGVCRANIGHIQRRTTWRHIG